MTASAAVVVKEALLAGLLALVLALPIIGLRTVDAGGALTIEPHWRAVGFAGVLVFLVKLAAGAWPYLVPRRAPDADPGSWWRAFARQRRTLAVAALGAAVAFPLLPDVGRYWVDLATTILIYVMLGWGLNIVVGLAGLLDLGYVAFYAVGAYSFGLLAMYLDLSFWTCLPLAGLIAAGFGILLGFPVLRLRGDYLAIVTLGFGEIIRIILINWYDFTNGPNGISGIPRPTLFGLTFTNAAKEGETAFHEYFGIGFSGVQRVIFLYYLILALALATNGFVLRMRKLPMGRAWEALREDEIAARALGLNPTHIKLSAFALGAMFGGFAGTFFATRQGFISPESFSFMESAVILAIVVLGGMGSQLGVVLAATVLIGLPELTRHFSGLGVELTQLRMLIFGAAMVAIMVWRPRGLLTRREPTARLDSTD
jgi:branched-chain amino acid transport system permease protein